jgi:hypothetical protein
MRFKGNRLAFQGVQVEVNKMVRQVLKPLVFEIEKGAIREFARALGLPLYFISTRNQHFSSGIDREPL